MTFITISLFPVEHFSKSLIERFSTSSMVDDIENDITASWPLGLDKILSKLRFVFAECCSALFQNCPLCFFFIFARDSIALSFYPVKNKLFVVAINLESHILYN